MDDESIHVTPDLQRQTGRQTGGWPDNVALCGGHLCLGQSYRMLTGAEYFLSTERINRQKQIMSLCFVLKVKFEDFLLIKV